MDDFKRVAELGLASLGIVGNGLLMAAWWRTRAGWHRLNLQLVGPIAVFDCLSALLGMLKASLSFSLGNPELFASPWFCTYLGTPILLFPCLSLLLIGIMSLDRYRLVVHGHGLSCFWGWLFSCVLGGALVCLLIVNTAVYGLVPDSTSTYCRPSGAATLTFVAHRLATLIILVDLAIVTFCYIGIYFQCRKMTAIYHTMPGKYLLILLVYQMCWLPKFITSLWGLFASQSTIPTALLIIGLFGLMLLPVVNPCLVFGLQASLRKEAFFLFSKQKALPEDGECFQDLSSSQDDTPAPQS